MATKSSTSLPVFPLIRDLPSRDRIPGFIRRISAVPKKEVAKLRGLALSEIGHIKRRRWTDHCGIVHIGYAPSTLRVILRDYRNAITAVLGAHPILDFLKPSKADQSTVQKETTAQVILAQRKARPVAFDELLDLSVEILADFESYHFYLVVAALLLTTGRRPIEVLRVGSFRRARQHDRASDCILPEAETLIFSGQAKTRGALSARTGAYRIPVLVNAELILDAIKYVRSKKDMTNIANHEVSVRTSSPLSRYTRRHFRDANDIPLKPKDLRAVYATISAEFCRIPSYLPNPFIGEILGHSEDDSVTSLSYMKFYENGYQRNFEIGRRSSLRKKIDEKKGLLNENKGRSKEVNRRRKIIKQQIDIFEESL